MREQVYISMRWWWRWWQLCTRRSYWVEFL